jgi:hypothetical protein
MTLPVTAFVNTAALEIFHARTDFRLTQHMNFALFITDRLSTSVTESFASRPMPRLLVASKLYA